MTGGGLYIILFITRLRAKSINITSHSVPFYNLFDSTIRSVDQQTNSPPKLAMEYIGFDKLLDYLRSDTKDVNQRH